MDTSLPGVVLPGSEQIENASNHYVVQVDFQQVGQKDIQPSDRVEAAGNTWMTQLELCDEWFHCLDIHYKFILI